MGRMLAVLWAWIASRNDAARLAAVEYDLARAQERVGDRQNQLDGEQQARRNAEAQIETMQVSLDGLTAIVEKYRQQQEAEARVFSIRGRPPRHDDDTFPRE